MNHSFKNPALDTEAKRKELFEKYCDYVYAIVFNRLRSCASREDIDECVCDVFADFFAGYDPAKVRNDVSGFVGIIARRKASAIYRKRTRSDAGNLSLDDENSPDLDSGVDIEADVEGKELRKLILDKIDELGEPDSTIILQKYYYGRSAKDISAATSLSPENVRVRCGRAIKKLREALERAGVSL